MQKSALRRVCRLSESTTWLSRRVQSPRANFALSATKPTQSIRNHRHIFKSTKYYSTIAESNPWSTMSTKDAISKVVTLLSSPENIVSLTEAEKSSLQSFCQEILSRAESGELEAQLFLGQTMTQDPDTANEAYIWYKRAYEDHGDIYALYAQASLMLTGTGELLTDQGASSSKADSKPYYIDTDNLDSFLGTDIGVDPNGRDPNSGAQFDFRKWLRAERRRIAREKKAQWGLSGESASAAAEPQVCSSHVDPVPVNKEEGEKLMIKAAEQGCQPAMLTLGSLYLDLESKILSFDEEKGLSILARAATQYANASAYYAVGDYLFAKEKAQGLPEGVSEEETSLFYIRKAAELGDADAIHFMGAAYHEGIPGLLEANPTLASEYFAQSALKKNSHSAYYLALMHLTGDGIPQNTAQALHYLRLAADLNHAEALFLLGEIYFNGSDGEEVDYPRALKLFKMAGKLGHAAALHNLGVMYYNGFGTKVDHEKAFYAYQNASVFNHIGAVENLADMYEKGIGVPQSDQNAQFYRMRAKEMREKEERGQLEAEEEAGDEMPSAKMLLDMLNDASLQADKNKPKPGDGGKSS